MSAVSRPPERLITREHADRSEEEGQQDLRDDRHPAGDAEQQRGRQSDARSDEAPGELFGAEALDADG